MKPAGLGVSKGRHRPMTFAHGIQQKFGLSAIAVRNPPNGNIGSANPCTWRKAGGWKAAVQISTQNELVAFSDVGTGRKGNRGVKG